MLVWAVFYLLRVLLFRCVDISAGCLVCLLSLCCVCLGLVFDFRKMETEKYLQGFKINLCKILTNE